MYRKPEFRKPVRYAICTVLAAALVAGCAGSMNFGKAGSGKDLAAQTEERRDKAVEQAERAVEKSPREASLRLELANAYLEAGRFDSAATTYEDAVSLGDGSARTALGMSLAYIGAGRQAEAVTVLDQWRDGIPAIDLGLALALAGETGRGVAILSDALRAGEANPKLRQNLAYAYALDGRWREARLMAAQDVPADQLDARISDWALQGRPEDYRMRIAGVLGAPLRTDAGQPRHLALAEPPVMPERADAAADLAAAPALAARPDRELPPADSSESFWSADVQGSASVTRTVVESPAPQSRDYVQHAAETVGGTFQKAFSEAAARVGYVSRPVVQPIPPRSRNRAPAVRAPEVRASGAGAPLSAAKPSSEECTHLVQLGSFSSPESARRAERIFASRHPGLKDHEFRISQAVVRGKTYWRVAAAGFDQASARSMCAGVKQRGGACFAYAEDRPLPGARPGNSAGGSMLARR